MIESFNRTKGLFSAVLLFVVLDLSVLLINFWIAHQVSHDAEAINLAGRQRMLSQRMTKALLLTTSADPAQHPAAENELREAVQLFDRTLFAFQHGGTTAGGQGSTVVLQQIQDQPTRKLLASAYTLWLPMHEQLLPATLEPAPIPASVLQQAREHMLRHNLDLLQLMNSIASNLEEDSKTRANLLRLVQTSVFLLALFNFYFIVRSYHLLTKTAEQANLHLGKLAMYDPLTGLFNRRQFEEALRREIAAADRQQRNFALVLIDLDDFKPVNDQHGHEAGDQVLRAIAERLAAQARSNDTVARVGGDEFVLICPDLADEAAALALCQRMITLLNESIIVNGTHISVGASIGIAFYPAHAGAACDLIRRADQAMYAAKQGGRNQCRIATEILHLAVSSPSRSPTHPATESRRIARPDNRCREN